MNKKQNILFIHPLGVNWMPNEHDMSLIANIMAPIGLLNLAAWVDKHGHESTIHDCFAFPGQEEKIYNHLIKEQPDYIGFTTITSSFFGSVRIAKNVKKSCQK